jgi:diacylglycerol kinase family enzyme
MDPHELVASLGRILERSPAFPDDELAVDLIANPRAGGFTRRAFSRLRHAELMLLESGALALAPRAKAVALRLHLTERCGHAGDIARGILAEARRDGPGTRRILMTAGGDGTALETASALADLSESERERICLLRLPMGTGNDGSEGRDLGACLGRLLGAAASSPRRAIRIRPNPAGGKPPLYSFNIASVGLDAYVCEMTNRLKAWLPGDSFKFWVDVASVFYDRIWPPAPLSVRAFDASGGLVKEFRKECLILAMGASGNRRYGSNKPVLPDDDNVCAIFQMSLFKKLAFKDRLAAGGHRGLGAEIVQLFSADRLELDYDRGILLQRDGEVDLLGSADFPLIFELTEPCYNVLEPA